MSLSKENLDKLNKYKNNKNFNKKNKNTGNHVKVDKCDYLTKNQQELDDPNNIFYSLIDNLESLEETTKVNHLLRNSEVNQININSRKANYFNKLTTEEELYDEFNYLLDD